MYGSTPSSARERVAHDLCGPLVVAAVGQRVAEEGRVPNLCGDIFRNGLADALQAALEQANRARGRAERGVSLTKRRVDVRAVLRRGRCVIRGGGLEPRAGRAVAPALGGGEPERDSRSYRRSRVAGSLCLGEDPLELLLRAREVVRQAKLELRIGEAKLSVVDLADVAARLEILDRDAELLRELAESLDGRRARSGLDPRDVRIRDPRRREVALRETPLKTKALEACANRLCRTAFRHAGLDHLRTSDISQIVNRRFLMATLALDLRNLLGKEGRLCIRGVAKCVCDRRGRACVPARFTVA